MLPRHRLLRSPPVLPAVLAVAIFAFACGSSSVSQVRDIGQPWRWVMLFVLGAAALAQTTRWKQPQVRHGVLLAAAAFVVLSFLSSSWSVDARLTFERSVTLAVLFAIATLLAHASALESHARERLLVGVLGGAAAVALAGLVVLATDYDAAVHPGSPDLPARYQGLGENPNTVALLLALGLPIVTWFLFRRGPRAVVIAMVGLGLLFDGSIVASGSRGALIAGFSGSLLVVLLAPSSLRVRAVAALALGALFAASVVIALAPKSAGHEREQGETKPAGKSTGAPARPRYLDAQGAYPLEFDIGSQPPGSLKPTPRPFLGLSGRSQAWDGALTLGDKRPVTGYGFGTEHDVFVDRYALFASELPESSYIGLYLQLGVVGLVSFAALGLALIAAAVQRRRRWEVAAPLGVLVTGLMLAVIQSYIYSVGNVATAAVWICAFLGAAALPIREESA